MRYTLAMRIAAAVLALAVLAAPAAAEKLELELSAPGLTKADLDLDLRLVSDCEPSACPAESTAAIVVTELTGNRYLFTGLPVVEAGDGDFYVLTFSDAGYRYHHAWPVSTITPTTTSAVLAYPIPKEIQVVAGTTLPVARLPVSGFSANPTGAAITFDLFDNTGAVVLDDVAAAVSGIVAQTDGTWRFELRHAWTSVETAALDGSYTGRFNVTLPGGDTIGLPQSPLVLRVRIFP
jgi:hypothetical protein